MKLNEFWKEHNKSITGFVIIMFVVIMSGIAVLIKQILDSSILSMTLIIAIFILIILNIILSAKLIDITKNNQIESILAKYQTKIDVLESDWYFSMERLAHFESNFKGDEIWVISKKLKYEISNESRFKDVIKANLEKRGISYKYFVPDEETLEPEIRKIRKLFSTKRPVIKVIKASSFDYPSDIIVFIDPYSQNSYSTFMELKVEIPLEKRGWAKVEDLYGIEIAQQISDDYRENKIKFESSRLFISDYQSPEKENEEDFSG